MGHGASSVASFTQREGVRGEDKYAATLFRRIDLHDEDVDFMYTIFSKIQDNKRKLSPHKEGIKATSIAKYFGVKNSNFMLKLFGAVADFDSVDSINFKEFTLGLWNFLTLSTDFLPALVFHLFDPMRLMMMDMKSFRDMLECIHSVSLSSFTPMLNGIVKKSFPAINSSSSSDIDVEEFGVLCVDNPLLMKPIVTLHHHLRQKMRGISYWKKLEFRRSVSVKGDLRNVNYVYLINDETEALRKRDGVLGIRTTSDDQLPCYLPSPGQEIALPQSLLNKGEKEEALLQGARQQRPLPLLKPHVALSMFPPLRLENNNEGRSSLLLKHQQESFDMKQSAGTGKVYDEEEECSCCSGAYNGAGPVLCDGSPPLLSRLDSCCSLDGEELTDEEEEEEPIARKIREEEEAQLGKVRKASINTAKILHDYDSFAECVFMTSEGAIASPEVPIESAAVFDFLDNERFIFGIVVDNKKKEDRVVLINRDLSRRRLKGHDLAKINSNFMFVGYAKLRGKSLPNLIRLHPNAPLRHLCNDPYNSPSGDESGAQLGTWNESLFALLSDNQTCAGIDYIKEVKNLRQKQLIGSIDRHFHEK